MKTDLFPILRLKFHVGEGVGKGLAVRNVEYLALFK